MDRTGIEPRISGSVDQRIIHWALKSKEINNILQKNYQVEKNHQVFYVRHGHALLLSRCSPTNFFKFDAVCFRFVAVDGVLSLLLLLTRRLKD